MHSDDTIFALSSGSLPSGVAIVRVSGPQVPEIMREMCGAGMEARNAHLKWIRNRNGTRIDKGIVVFYPGPNSFTGEDCLEFNIHGGKAVVGALLTALKQFDNTRHAEAGEFSRRAFENGKLDLVEIEGLADLISAETEMQRRLALELANGGASRLYSSWAEELTRIRAMIEAELDFADEGDIPDDASSQGWVRVQQIRDAMSEHIADGKIGEVIRDGLKIVIVGRPNAGKSSLLNFMAGRELAIVTEFAGTTRDTISVDLDMDGYLVRITDTAGLRETDDKIEMLGIERALKAVRDADIVINIKDRVDPAPFVNVDIDKVVFVESKWDVSAGLPHDDQIVRFSSINGNGFDSLKKRIGACLEEIGSFRGQAMPSRARHLASLERARASLSEALSESEQIELRAECLRRAAHALGQITGRVDVEDLLGVIFSEFCIGK